MCLQQKACSCAELAGVGAWHSCAQAGRAHATENDHSQLKMLTLIKVQRRLTVSQSVLEVQQFLSVFLKREAHLGWFVALLRGQIGK